MLSLLFFSVQGSQAMQMWGLTCGTAMKLKICKNLLSQWVEPFHYISLTFLQRLRAGQQYVQFFHQDLEALEPQNSIFHPSNYPITSIHLYGNSRGVTGLDSGSLGKFGPNDLIFESWELLIACIFYIKFAHVQSAQLFVDVFHNFLRVFGCFCGFANFILHICRFPSTVITVQFSHDAPGASGGPLRSRTYDGLEVSLEPLSWRMAH